MRLQSRSRGSQRSGKLHAPYLPCLQRNSLHGMPAQPSSRTHAHAHPAPRTPVVASCSYQAQQGLHAQVSLPSAEVEQAEASCSRGIAWVASARVQPCGCATACTQKGQCCVWPMRVMNPIMHGSKCLTSFTGMQGLEVGNTHTGQRRCNGGRGLSGRRWQQQGLPPGPPPPGPSAPQSAQVDTRDGIRA